MQFNEQQTVFMTIMHYYNYRIHTFWRNSILELPKTWAVPISTTYNENTYYTTKYNSSFYGSTNSNRCPHLQQIHTQKHIIHIYTLKLTSGADWLEGMFKDIFATSAIMEMRTFAPQSYTVLLCSIDRFCNKIEHTRWLKELSSLRLLFSSIK